VTSSLHSLVDFIRFHGRTLVHRFNGLIRDDMEMYGNFSTAYIPLSSQVLEEWVAKVQGMRSISEHPSPRAILSSPDDWRRCANIVAFRESEPYVRDPHFS
jgi:hypothetical protein